MLVKQETIIVTETITDGELLNQHLERDIRDAGYGSKLTTAKCYRTRWDMHKTSDAFALLGQGAISVAKRFYTNECDENGNPKKVPKKLLPVKLPKIEKLNSTGNSLDEHNDWKLIEIDGKKYTRETDTLDTFVDSSWCFLRFCSPKETKSGFNDEDIKLIL